MHNLFSICIISVLTLGWAQVKAFPAEGQCGSVGRRKGKIINGDIAQVSQFPWIASIKYRNLHFCGGTIVANKFILSAAHCFEQQLVHGHIVEARHLSQYSVTLGDYSQLVNEEQSVNYTIKRLIFHKEYRKLPLKNDIVLLELSSKIEWTDYIQSICLPTEDVITSDKAIAAGWGRDIIPTITKEDNSKLRFIEIKIFDNDRCKSLHSERNLRTKVGKSQMCAGRLDETRDTNEGDSVGPLLVNLGGREILVGITSSGTPESIYPKAPGVYTRVFEYLDWIEEHTRGVR